MSAWDEKQYREGWYSKTHNRYKEHYEFQKQELLKDMDTIDPHRVGTYLDVGGGDGRIGLGKVIDLQNGFDLCRSWEDQGLTEQFDIVFSSLALIAVPPEYIDYVVREMFVRAKRYIYLFEEASCPVEQHGTQIDGGKWQYNWQLLFQNYPFDYFKIKQAKSNPAWDKVTIKLLPLMDNAEQVLPQ